MLLKFFRKQTFLVGLAISLAILAINVNAMAGDGPDGAPDGMFAEPTIASLEQLTSFGTEELIMPFGYIGVVGSVLGLSIAGCGIKDVCTSAQEAAALAGFLLSTAVATLVSAFLIGKVLDLVRRIFRR